MGSRGSETSRVFGADVNERYRLTQSTLIVTKPTGEVVQREVVLAYDVILDMIEVVFKGESILKGYSFGILQRECDRVKVAGTPAADLPRIVE